MKFLIILTLALMIGGGTTCPAFADNFFDDMTDVFKGRNEDLPADLYVAYTTKGNLPLIPGKIRIKVSTPYGDKFFEEGRIQTGIEF